jgi:hypothetical protein
MDQLEYRGSVRPKRFVRAPEESVPATPITQYRANVDKTRSDGLESSEEKLPCLSAPKFFRVQSAWHKSSGLTFPLTSPSLLQSLNIMVQAAGHAKDCAAEISTRWVNP